MNYFPHPSQHIIQDSDVEWLKRFYDLEEDAHYQGHPIRSYVPKLLEKPSPGAKDPDWTEKRVGLRRSILISFWDIVYEVKKLIRA
jgi:hypothetical protein